MRKLALWAAVALLPLAAFAAQITLRNGTTYTGRFLNGSSTTITFQDDNGVQHRLSIGEVRSIDFGGGNLGSADRGMRADKVVPAGAQVAVRTSEAIDSNTAATGQTFSAAIDRDVADDSGNVVIPKGSDAQLVIRQVNAGGGITGSPNLVLDLDSVTVQGTRYTVSTEDLKQSSRSGIGKNRRTGEMVGGGAVLGTVIGAIAGGGKGAAIGAIAGAAAGGAAQVLTKGKRVKVPAETVLTFQLDQPLRLTRS